MDFRNCPACGSIFRYQTRNLCPVCVEAEEKEFDIVRNYVRDHPGENIFQVSQATGVSEDKIIRFLRDGRLIARGISTEGVLTCDRCGQTISEGRLCPACRGELSRDLQRQFGPRAEGQPAFGSDHNSPVYPGNRMHTSEIIKRRQY